MKLFQYISLDKDSQVLLDEGLPQKVSLTMVNRNGTEEQQLEQFLDCEIAFGNIPAVWIDKSPVIKWLQLESVGYEPYLDILPAFNKRGTITNLQGFFGLPVAETAIAGLLSLKRGINKLISLKEKKEWRDNSFRANLTTLYGAKTLIAGGGNIGQSFKKILSGFDAETVIYDKNPDFADIVSVNEFDNYLSTADIIFSSLPENVRTDCFFDERRFRLMKPTAIFINAGRGTVVDESALIRMLDEKLIAGAVLDVTCREPLPSDDKLWDCPNLILTQHTGGGSRNELKGKVEIFLENLDLYVNNKTLTRQVQI